MNAVNLVPADARRRGASVSTGLPFLGLLGGLVLILVATLLFVTAHNRVDSRKTQLAAVQASAARWTAAAGSYAHDVSVNTSRQSAIAKVENLAGSRYDWSVLLGRLGDAMPQKSVLSSLAVTPAAASSTASSSSTPASASTATSIALSACATSQSVVAQTMVNLRRIAGVSQVILSSSTTGGTSGGASGGGCPYRVAFSLTLAFAPPPADPSTSTGATAPAAGDPSSTSSSPGTAQ